MLYPPAPPGARSRRWLWHALAAVLGLVVGGTIGAAAVGTGSPDREPPVPSACLDAIDLAEDGFAATAAAMTGVQDAWEAAELYDAAAVAAATLDIERAGEQLTALTPGWDRARAECRAAAR